MQCRVLLDTCCSSVAVYACFLCLDRAALSLFFTCMQLSQCQLHHE